MSHSLIPSFLVSNVSESLRLLTKMNDVSKSLRSLTKNEQRWAIRSGLTKNEQPWAKGSGRSPKMGKLLVILRESLIRSFFRKKRAIRSENCWVNSQPWRIVNKTIFLENQF